MKKVDSKKFSCMAAYDYESALHVLGACALEKVSLIRYRQYVSEYDGCHACREHMEYIPVHVQYGYVWKSLVSDCWLRAEMHNNIVPEYAELVCFPQKKGEFTEQELQALLNVPPVYDEIGHRRYYGPVEG